MSDQIKEIIDLCRATGNTHFIWFARLLENHLSGIIAHATFRISSGKIEGINNKIKTLRRQGYGYPDDDYFFLKIVDASRKPARVKRSSQNCSATELTASGGSWLFFLVYRSLTSITSQAGK